MKKTTKINIAIASVLLCCGIAYLTCYIVIPQQTIEFSMGVRDFFLQPLPIIGVSLGFIALLVWKFIKTTSFGQKQIALLNEKHDEAQQKLEESKILLEQYKQHAQSQFDALKSKNEELREYIVKLCDMIPNKKVKEFGKEISEYEREETTNIEATEE